MAEESKIIMAKEPKTMSNILRAVVFSSIVGVLLETHPAFCGLVCVGSAFYFFKKRKIVTSVWDQRWVRLAKYVAVAALIAGPAANSAREDARLLQAADAEAKGHVSEANSLIEKGEFGMAMEIFRKVSLGKTKWASASNIMIAELALLAPDDSLKYRVKNLSKKDFENLLSGGSYNFVSNPHINSELLKRAHQLSKNLKGDYYKAKEVEAKLAQAKAKEQAKLNRQIASYGEPPAQSAWDGSYRAVEKYLEQAANDPDSIKMGDCTDVRIHEGKGYVVGCQYRGKNAFGGMVKNANWFIIRHGRVVQVLGASAYR